MIHTAEMRWFYKGELLPVVQTWFETLNAMHDVQPPRTDYYVYSSDEGLNVKLREGRAEIKRRVAPGEIVSLPNGSTGCCEHWYKWSLPLDESALLEEHPLWTSVRKKRTMLRYHLGEHDTVLPMFPGVETNKICTVELSQVEKQGAWWWSVCFEASGYGNRLNTAVMKVAEYVLQQPGAPDLDREHAMGYPAWLLA